MLTMFIIFLPRKMYWEEITASLLLNLSQEAIITRWMVKRLIFVCDYKEEQLHLSSSEIPEELTHLLPSSCACCTLFWAYFQLTCLLWKRVLNGNDGLMS